MPLRLAITLLALSLWLPAQPLEFTPVLFEQPAPAGRVDAPPVYDPANRTLYVFGGRGASSLNDLWAYSFQSAGWSRLTPAGGPPPARFGHTAVFDSLRRRIIVFGGQAAGFFNDVWAYDIAANRWSELTPPGPAPNTRYGHAAIYDTQRDRMLISHGFTDAGRFDDTWAFNLATNTWANISPAQRPLRRCLHHAVYDPAGNQMLFYGGCASGAGPCPLDDLWSFDLEQHRWREITASPRPAGRQWYGLTFDTDRRRMVVFGGSTSLGALADVWEFDPAVEQWRMPAVAQTAPSPRSRHEGIYAADQRRSLFFGGQSTQGSANELWALGPAVANGRPAIFSGGAVNSFSYQNGVVSPGEIVSFFGMNLGPQAGVVTQFDELTGQLPREAAGIVVMFDEIAAPVYYGQEGQINAQTPYEIAGREQTDVTVRYNEAVSLGYRLAVAATHPGLFPGIFNQNLTLNSLENPAQRGSIVVLYLTGQGVTVPPVPTGAFPIGGFPEPADPVDVMIGGLPADILFQGLISGAAGVLQINARMSVAVEPGEAVAVDVGIGGARSQAGVMIAVE